MKKKRCKDVTIRSKGLFQRFAIAMLILYILLQNILCILNFTFFHVRATYVHVFLLLSYKYSQIRFNNSFQYFIRKSFHTPIHQLCFNNTIEFSFYELFHHLITHIPGAALLLRGCKCFSTPKADQIALFPSHSILFPLALQARGRTTEVEGKE